MFIVKLILIPFWPIFIGWKLSAGTVAKTNDGTEHPILGRLIGTVIVAGLIYYGVIWAVMKVVDFADKTESNASEPAEQTSAEVTAADSQVTK